MLLRRDMSGREFFSLQTLHCRVVGRVTCWMMDVMMELFVVWMWV